MYPRKDKLSPFRPLLDSSIFYLNVKLTPIIYFTLLHRSEHGFERDTDREPMAMYPCKGWGGGGGTCNL